MINYYSYSKQELLDMLDLLFERLGQYPYCEHISNEIDRVLEAISERED